MTHVTSRRTVWSSRLIVSFLLLALTSLAGAQSLTAHKFEFDTRNLPQKPQRVNLAGSFNGWSTVATPMTDRGDGVYEVEVKLSEGVHFYKFVVNGDQWINDPKSDKELEQPDGHGGMNSAVLIGPDVREFPPPKPNHVNPAGIAFDAHSDVNVFAAGKARIRVRAQKGDVEGVTVLPSPRTRGLQGQPLPRTSDHRGFDVFAGVCDFDPADGEFLLLVWDGGETGWFDRTGFHSARPGPERPEKFAMFSFPEAPVFETPDWARHAVWYQIFPERFRNGDTSNDPGEQWYENLLPWTADWWKAHVEHGETPGEENFYTGEGNVWKRRFGGDIQGVKEALPYLRSLGINAIYFNPVFEGDSMHKYDTSDFRHIDDNFGVKGDIPIKAETDDPATWQWSKSDKIFLDFIQEAHRQGFKVVIDGVFNHVGRSHPYFQDVIKNGKNSKYADWFEITDWGTGGEPGEPGGIQWKAWDRDNGHLPVFKKDPEKGLAPGPYNHIMAITKRWLAPDGDPSKGIDGWRLDVPGDIPHPFWIEWRKVVKETKPDAYITGEIWEWAQPWLQGDQFDAVMNYRFAVACQEFFVNQQKAISPSELNSKLNEMIFAYPLQVALVQQNLFDSHDTDRLASMFVNPDLPYDGANRLQDNGPNYDKSKPNEEHWARKRQAVVFQMMFLGAPMVYYGSEAGMWSPDDPSNRMPMWWKDHEPFENPEFRFNEDHFRHYQRAIAIRNKFAALQTGFFRPLVIDDERGIYGFVRELNDERVYVVMNRSSRKARVEMEVAENDANATLVDWMNADQTIVVEPDAKVPDGRPTVELKNTAKLPRVSGTTVTIEVAAYETAVLTTQH